MAKPKNECAAGNITKTRSIVTLRVVQGDALVGAQKLAALGMFDRSCAIRAAMQTPARRLGAPEIATARSKMEAWVSITKSRVDKSLNTVRAICKNPAVVEFVIGRTAASAQRRGDQYRQEGIPHTVVLADHLKDKDAGKLESELQRRCGLGPDCPPDLNRREAVCRKYHHEKDARRASNGGSKNARSRQHSVYLSWWEK